jgi:hypothetical protein
MQCCNVKLGANNNSKKEEEITMIKLVNTHTMAKLGSARLDEVYAALKTCGLSQRGCFQALVETGWTLEEIATETGNHYSLVYAQVNSIITLKKKIYIAI